jgi:hypothetical protein
VRTSKPNVVKKKVCQIPGSQASSAVVGRRVPSHERGFQRSSRALPSSAWSSRTRHLDAEGGVLVRGLDFLGEMS